MHRPLLRHGFILILLALLSGLAIPSLSIPRLGLSAHTIGILSGTLLIAIGAIWKQFRLGSRQQWLMYWAWLYASYVNWLGCLLGATLGAGQTTPVAAAGAQGAPWAESLVAGLLISVALASLLAITLALWGIRGQAPAQD